MRDLSHYPIGIVPSHVWRRAAPAAAKPAPQPAPQPDTSANLSSAPPPASAASGGEGAGVVGDASSASPRTPAVQSTSPSSSAPPRADAPRRKSPARLASALPTAAPGKGAHPLPGKSSIRPEVAEGYAALFKLLREIRDCWRECPAGECRRHRRCVSEKYECGDLRRVTRTPEQEAAILADCRRALQRRLAELHAAGERV
jgi:hypothetical protein